MQFKSQIKNFSLAAVIGCAALFSVSAASVKQEIAPTATLEVGPATVVDAQRNFVTEQPLPAREIPFRPTMNRSDYDAAKARANFWGPGAKPFTGTFAPLATPVIKTNNFSGHSSTEGLRPAGTHGAVGTTHFVQVTNSHIDVYGRVLPSSGVPMPLLQSVTLATFFSYTTETLFDPRVVYDSTWNRWIVTAVAFPESSNVQRLFIAVSTTADPTGSFFMYNLNVTFFTGDLYDFPQLGMDQDAVLFTANIFNGSSFHGADFFSVAKARLYNGLGFSVPVFTGLVGTLAPPIVRDQNSSTFLIAAPPSGTTFSKYTATNTSKGTTLTGPVSITVPSYSVPPSAHQPGTTKLLDTSDSRFVNASTQSGNDLWQTHTIALGSFPAPKFYRLNTSTNTVSQSGFYFGSATSDDFNASIVANDAGNCFVTWTSTDASAGNNAQVRLSGKLSADAGIAAGPNAFTSPTFYNASADNPELWGAYSAVTTDPLNAADAWLVNETVTADSAIWGSRIVQFGF